MTGGLFGVTKRGIQASSAALPVHVGKNFTTQKLLWHFWVYIKTLRLYRIQLSKHEQGQRCGGTFRVRINVQLQGSPLLYVFCYYGDGRQKLMPVCILYFTTKPEVALQFAVSRPYTPLYLESHTKPGWETKKRLLLLLLLLHLQCFSDRNAWVFCYEFVCVLGQCVGVHQHCIVLQIWLRVKRRSEWRGKTGLPERSRAAGSIPRSQLPWAGWGLTSECQASSAFLVWFQAGQGEGGDKGGGEKKPKIMSGHI